MTGIYRTLLPFLGLAVFFCAGHLQGVELDLASLLQKALKRNAEIKEANQDVAIAFAQADRADAAAFPRGEATFVGAPMPEIRGNALSSDTNLGKWGPLFTGSIQLVQPLFTFGQLGGYRSAAEHQILARREQAKMKAADVIFRTKEYYYGYLMAVSLDKLVDKILEILDEAIVEADKNKKKKNSKIKPHDVYQLKTETETIRQLKLKAVSGRKVAEKAVSWMTATPFEKLPTKKFKPEVFEKRSLEEYLDLARQYRPEFKALAAGQKARAALRDAKQSQSYPTVFLGGTLGFAWSSVTDSQPTIFALDPFNNFFGGVGIGLRFDLEFWRHSAEAAEEEAERLKLKAQETYAKPGIELQVKKAFWEFEEAERGLEIAKKRKKLARRWFVSNASGWTLGITTARDLMDSVEGDGKAKMNYIQTVYAYNIALAHLTTAVGKEVTELKY